MSRSLTKLETLKPGINKRYERYLQHIQERELRRAGGNTSRHTRGEVSEHEHALDAAINGPRRQIAAGDNRDLAVKLARQEIQRRATVRRTTHEAAGIEDDVSSARIPTLQPDGDGQGTVKDNRSIVDNDLDRQMQNIRLELDRRKDTDIQHHKAKPSSRHDSLRYPTVPEKSAYNPKSPFTPLSSAHELRPAQGMLKPSKAPGLSPNGDLYDNERWLNTFEGVPEPPPKSPMTGSPTPISEPRSATSTPTQSELQPSTFTFKPAAYLENGQPLRTIFLPPDLRFRFLSIASTNTRLKLETCGILCGTLISNALFISKLVIPDQESTSDTCDTINESDLFDYCDAEDLMVLGWIHTHPTQSCFMSSRDLHTHCGYQVMMPESIAIVCAPSRGE